MDFPRPLPMLWVGLSSSVHLESRLEVSPQNRMSDTYGKFRVRFKFALKVCRSNLN